MNVHDGKAPGDCAMNSTERKLGPTTRIIGAMDQFHISTPTSFHGKAAFHVKV